jgi:hypothetical protein
MWKGDLGTSRGNGFIVTTYLLKKREIERTEIRDGYKRHYILGGSFFLSALGILRQCSLVLLVRSRAGKALGSE